MHNKKGGRNWFGKIPFFMNKRSYEPWYDEHSDYNTNAKSYYDYLSRFNHLIRTIVDFVNRALDRNIMVEDTKSIEFKKSGEWHSKEDCEVNDYDDIVQFKAHVKISNATETKGLYNTKPTSFTIKNGAIVKNDGVWTPDYYPLISAIDDVLGIINNDIRLIKKDVATLNKELVDLKAENQELRNGLQKIINNLHTSGAITTNVISTYSFNTGRNIATGNINLFGGTPDGNSFIRTSSGSRENDITAGV